MNWLRIHVSNLCNFKCPNCHVFELGENVLPNRVMAQEVFDLAVENFTRAMTYLGLAETRISIYGGETLANKKVVKAGIEKFGAVHNGVKLNWVINTNGSLLKEEDVLFFKHHDVEVHISVDGREEIHNLSRPTHKGKGTFHMVTPALELVKKHGPPAQINSYMMPSNYLHLKDIVDIADAYGIRKIYLDQFYNTEMISYRVGMEKYREIYFYAMRKDVSISGPWARVLLNHQRNKSKRERLRYLLALDVNIDGSCYVPLDAPGTKKLNLRIEDFADYVGRGGWDEISDLVRRKNDRSCGDCPIKEQCYGGAIEQVHYHIGDHADPQVSCDFFRDWIAFLTRPVYFRKFPEVQVLSVLSLPAIEALVTDVRAGIRELSRRLWAPTAPISLNISEHPEEFQTASMQEYLPAWAKATTRESTFFHRGTEITPALIHELAHIFLYQKGLRLPDWFAEGVCEWIQNPTYNRRFLIDALATKPLTALLPVVTTGTSLIELDGAKPGRNTLYVQAQAFVDFLLRTHFAGDLHRLVLPTAEQSLDAHLMAVTGRSLDQLLGDFEEHVRTVVAAEVAILEGA
jgi:sulfatase maturation enzyme AslB (radical SAM superfamily)